MRNLNRAGFTIHELLIGLFVLLWLGGFITVICVAWHFIAKFW